MNKIGRNDPCPCGSGKKYKQCCGPAVEGGIWPGSPEALMRSRYTAYVVGSAEHLYRTTHPENEAVKGVERDRFLAETRTYCETISFDRLTVHEATPPDERGVAHVSFTAEYRLGGEVGSFTERSAFVQLDGKWLYHSGEHDGEE